MPTQTLGEVAASQLVYCTYPDDGSGWSCPRKLCMPHELLSIKKGGKTVNCCFGCWTHCESSASQVKALFEAAGGYEDGVDPKIREHNHSKNLFKVLCQKVHAKEARKLVGTPRTDTHLLHAICKQKYHLLQHALPFSLAQLATRRRSQKADYAVDAAKVCLEKVCRCESRTPIHICP